MGDHEIVWRHETDHVIAEVVCLAPPTSQCRWTADDCECEMWSEMARDNEGPYHVTVGYDDEDTEIGDVKHRMTDGGACNVALYLNEEPGMIPEAHADVVGFDIGRTPIQPVWNDDHYEWKRAT